MERKVSPFAQLIGIDMRRAGVTVLAAAFLLTACSGSTSAYSAEIRSNFLNACQVNASASDCACALARIEARVSEADFVRAEVALGFGQSVDERTMDAITDAMLDCM